MSLNIDIHKIPNFANDGIKWTNIFSNWFNHEFGKCIIPVKLLNKTESIIFNKSLTITNIKSDNSNHDDRHAIITIGDLIVFDPEMGFVNKSVTDEMDAIYLSIGDVTSSC